MENIYVETDTVDVEISCHQVQMVAETAMTTYLLLFTVPTMWQQPQRVREISCHMESISGATITVNQENSCRMESIFLATIIVNQEISCHTVMIVTQTTMFAFIVHFEKQLPRSRVHW